MRWQGRRQSRNIEDRRGAGGRAGRGALPAGGIGLLVLLAVGYFLGIDVTPLLDEAGAPPSAPAELTEADRQAAAFVAVTLADTEEVWAGLFRDQLGATYVPPVLVLYRDVTSSPCGSASGATGPFYCPADRKIYLDTGFFAALSQRLGAGGDFAAAYVVAHEVAHHVQNLRGVLARVAELRAGADQAHGNALSVRVELQADCLAGVWAHHAAMSLGTLEAGDLEEAVNAARQIGDDRLQRGAGRVPQPHSFTHGTSAQRSRWFLRGARAGRVADCDTFSVAEP